jgi:hypothetical protein
VVVVAAALGDGLGRLLLVVAVLNEDGDARVIEERSEERGVVLT